MTPDITIQMVNEHIEALREYRMEAKKNQHSKRTLKINDIIEDGVNLTNKISLTDLEDLSSNESFSDCDREQIEILKQEIKLTVSFINSIK